MTRKQAEDALRESEARLARVLEGSSDGFGDFDAATGDVSITPRYREIYGLPTGTRKISVEALLAFVEPADLPPIQADMAAFSAGEKDSHVWEYRIRRADGTTRWIQSRGSVVGRDASGRPAHVSGAITDITERVLAEQGLRTALERLRRAEEFARFGHWEYSLDDRIMRASEGASRIYGFFTSTIPLEAIRNCALAQYRPILDRALGDLIEHNLPFEQEFAIHRISDGEVVQVHSKAEYDAKTRRIFGVVQDITQRKRIEEERERLIRELQRAIEQVKTLSGIVPICAHCKRIRDDRGYWEQVEAYVSEHTEAEFSHSICPQCFERFYPDG